MTSHTARTAIYNRRRAGPVKARRRARTIAAAAAGAAVLALAAYAAVVHHVGAPKLPITCQAPDFPSRWWVSGSGPADVSTAAEVHWLGSTEISGCSESLTIGLNTTRGPAASRLVFGGHQHNLMGAITGIYDAPDGKYVLLAAAVLVVAAAARAWRRVGRVLRRGAR